VKLEETFGALRERPFRLLWIGQATSAVGDSMTPVALVFAVLESRGSAGDLGFVLAAYTLAHSVFILAGGVWGDRLERRLVMLGCDLVRAAAQFTLAAIVISGSALLWQFIALAVVIGAAESFFSPASTGLIPQTISADRLQQANALLALTRSGAWIFGPALSGVIVAAAGAGWVFAIDGLTFLVSAAFLFVLRPVPAPLAERQSFVGDLAHGWREVRARRWLWASLLGFGTGNFAWGAVQVVGPVVAEQELAGASSWGVIMAGGGIGGLVGGLLALRWRPERPLLVGSAIIFLLALYMAGFVPPLPTVALAALAFVAFFAIIVSNTLWETTLQQQVPREALSRISSYDWAVSLVFMPIGFAAWGPLSEWIGVDATLLLGASVVVASKVGVLLVPEVRNLRRVETAEDGPAAVSAAAS
jgi:MFS family permease